MNYERGVEVYFNQFTKWRDGYFIANTNLVEGDDGLCKGWYHEGVKAAITANRYIGEAMIKGGPPMIVSQLIEWLKTQDQGATVQVVTIGAAPTYESYGPAVLVEMDVTNADHMEYIDFRGNRFVESNQRYLTFGSTD